jgi:hypothetical protein
MSLKNPFHTFVGKIKILIYKKEHFTWFHELDRWVIFVKTLDIVLGAGVVVLQKRCSTDFWQIYQNLSLKKNKRF